MCLTITHSNLDTAFVKRKKLEIEKKYSPSHAESIRLVNYLAVYLLAAASENESKLLLASCRHKLVDEGCPAERWEAIVLSKALLIHLNLNNTHQSDVNDLRLAELNFPIEPIAGAAEFYFERLHESLESNIVNVIPFTPMEKCMHFAELYLQLAFGVVLRHEQKIIFEEKFNLKIEDRLEYVISDLQVALASVR